MMLLQSICTPRDLKGDRIIEGVASSSARNSKGDYKLPSGCVARLPVPVLWGHAPNLQIGEVTALMKTASTVFIRCEIYWTALASRAWAEIEAGRASCFSVGTWRNRGLQLPGLKVFTSWELGEVSVVEAGCNPDASFRIVRNRGATPPGAMPGGAAAAVLARAGYRVAGIDWSQGARRGISH